MLYNAFKRWLYSTSRKMPPSLVHFRIHWLLHNDILISSIIQRVNELYWDVDLLNYLVCFKCEGCHAIGKWKFSSILAFFFKILTVVCLVLMTHFFFKALYQPIFLT